MDIELTHEQKLKIFTEIFDYYVIDGIIEALKTIDLDKFKTFEEAEQGFLSMAEADLIECLGDVEINLEDLADDAIKDLKKQAVNLDIEEEHRNIEPQEYLELEEKEIYISRFIDRLLK